MAPVAADARDTKQLLVTAALQVLRRDGYGAATARRIAEEAGCNQALVFYHHGSLANLLLAAVDESSDARLRQYQQELSRAATLRQVLQLPAKLYREDQATGHGKVLVEMISAALASEQLRRHVASRVAPWVAVVEEAFDRVLRRSPVRRLVPPHQLAYGVVAFFIGLEVLGTLQDDRAPALALLDRIARAGSRLERLLGDRSG